MDEIKARDAFEQAIASYSADFGTFFLARLFGLAVSYRDAAGESIADDAPAADVERVASSLVEMRIEDFMFNPQGGLHGGITAMVMDIAMGAPAQARERCRRHT